MRRIRFLRIKSSEQDFQYVCCTISRILLWNLFTWRGGWPMPNPHPRRRAQREYTWLIESGGHLIVLRWRLAYVALCQHRSHLYCISTKDSLLWPTIYQGKKNATLLRLALTFDVCTFVRFWEQIFISFQIHDFFTMIRHFFAFCDASAACAHVVYATCPICICIYTCMYIFVYMWI